MEMDKTLYVCMYVCGVELLSFFKELIEWGQNLLKLEAALCSGY